MWSVQGAMCGEYLSLSVFTYRLESAFPRDDNCAGHKSQTLAYTSLQRPVLTDCLSVTGVKCA